MILTKFADHRSSLMGWFVFQASTFQVFLQERGSSVLSLRLFYQRFNTYYCLGKQ